jgi:hypothetical protein
MMTVTHINNMGGQCQRANLVMWKIVVVCHDNNLQLAVIHLPGKENENADWLSCLHPHHKWKMNHSTFLAIDEKWGPHTVDQMATGRNTQLLRYHSCFFKLGSAATNCLVQDWAQENSWVALPIALIP